MKRSECSGGQIVYGIWWAESCTPVGDLCWLFDLSEATYGLEAINTHIVV